MKANEKVEKAIHIHGGIDCRAEVPAELLKARQIRQSRVTPGAFLKQHPKSICEASPRVFSQEMTDATEGVLVHNVTQRHHIRPPLCTQQLQESRAARRGHDIKHVHVTWGMSKTFQKLSGKSFYDWLV